MSTIIIDATDLIVGRIGTFAAKQALLGNEVKIINSEKAVIGGKREVVLADYQRKRSMGIPAKGPFFHRMPDRLLRRIIRGMLPYKKPRGREAYERIMCYLGIPEEFVGKDVVTIEGANVSKLPSLKYVDLKTLSKTLGAKIE